MTQNRTTSATSPQRVRPAATPDLAPTATPGANSRVEVSNWTISFSGGQLYSEGVVTTKNAGDLIADLSIALYSTSGDTSGGSKLLAWGMVGEPVGASTDDASLEASLATNLYNPAINGTRLIGILAGDLNVSSVERVHFSVQRQFTVTTT